MIREYKRPAVQHGLGSLQCVTRFEIVQDHVLKFGEKIPAMIKTEEQFELINGEEPLLIFSNSERIFIMNKEDQNVFEMAVKKQPLSLSESDLLKACVPMWVDMKTLTWTLNSISAIEYFMAINWPKLSRQIELISVNGINCGTDCFEDHLSDASGIVSACLLIHASISDPSFMKPFKEAINYAVTNKGAF